MDWVTTNIRLPEDQYLELKMQAARERKSLAALIRQKLAKKKLSQDKKNATLIRNFTQLAKQVAKENKGVNLTKALLEMRYEQ